MDKGKGNKMSKQIKRKNGKTVTLLTPNEKATKYADELRNGVKLTNDGHIKFDKFGSPQRLSPDERKFRSGYLTSRSDEAKLFKWKQKHTS